MHISSLYGVACAVSLAGAAWAQGLNEPVEPTAEMITIRVDCSKSIGQISPLIYGINHNDFSRRPWVPFTRQGGNRMTAYNWENNASSAGSDWQHQNDAYLGGGDKPGEVARGFAESALKANASVVVTVPMAGYVAADKKGDGDVNKTPGYLNVRFRKSLAKKKAPFAYPPDLADEYVYQDEFVWWLNREFATQKDRIFYSLDNEPELWSSTHARIHPEKVTFAEIVEKTRDLAGAIRDINPSAVIFGFASYGYNGFTSLQDAPDRQGRDFIEFFLTSMKDLEKQQGRRLIDVMDLHWYPEAQGGGERIVFGRGNSPAKIRARVQAPRSLWDKTYTEDSWIARDAIHGPVVLLPRIKEKIDRCYPGMKLAFMEYDYGGGDHISGAVAQADVLGIFGREGVHAAALWGGGPFIYAGFEAYLNYDGKGGRFGDQVLAASTSHAEAVSAYGSLDSNGVVKLVLINRSDSPQRCRMDLTGWAGSRAELYRVSSIKPAVQPAGQAQLKSGDVLELPAMSVTTAVLGQ